MTQADRQRMWEEFLALCKEECRATQILEEVRTRIAAKRLDVARMEKEPGCTHKKADGTSAVEVGFVGPWCPYCGMDFVGPWYPYCGMEGEK